MNSTYLRFLIITDNHKGYHFPMELHLKNIYYLYSPCSNPTNVVLLIVLSMIIGKGAGYWDR